MTILFQKLDVILFAYDLFVIVMGLANFNAFLKSGDISLLIFYHQLNALLTSHVEELASFFWAWRSFFQFYYFLFSNGFCHLLVNSFQIGFKLFIDSQNLFERSLRSFNRNCSKLGLVMPKF